MKKAYTTHSPPLYSLSLSPPLSFSLLLLHPSSSLSLSFSYSNFVHLQTFQISSIVPENANFSRTLINLSSEYRSKHQQDSQQGCEGDALGFLDNFLKLGVEVELDEGQIATLRAAKPAGLIMALVGSILQTVESHSSVSNPQLHKFVKRVPIGLQSCAFFSC